MSIYRNLVRAAAGTAAATGLLLGGATAALAGNDAIANVYVNDAKVAYGKFISYGDKIKVCKTHSYGNKAYVDYWYVRKDGTLQDGRHWSPGGKKGDCQTYDHNFGEGRKVVILACVQVDWATDPCSNYETGYA